MFTVSPTITVDTAQKFKEYGELLTTFANRIHVDSGDSDFSGHELLPLENMNLPADIGVDLHAMFRRPLEKVETMISLNPQLIIIHAESSGVIEFLNELDGLAVKKGVALLQDTPADSIKPYIDLLDHVLVFSGTLGTWGGTADLGLLSKVQEIKTWRPELEIGWDGGINESNIKQLAQSGVDVGNVGGYISRAANPEEAYNNLLKALTL